MKNFTLDSFKEMRLKAALKLTAGSPSKAAKMIGISRATVYRWMKKYGIERNGE